jgi:hypothetical protein
VKLPAALAALCLLVAPAFGADDLAEARAALADARMALEESSRDHARVLAGDWSGVMTIEGDKVIKCGDPSKYPELDCKPYSEAEKAAMLAEQAEGLAAAKRDLEGAERDLAAAEAAQNTP